MKKLSVAFLLAALFAQPAFSRDLVIVSFGGANKDAQTAAFYDTYTKSTGRKVIASEYSGELAKIRAMVDTQNVGWDVVEVGATELARGCDEGMFETLDWNKLPGGKDLIDGATQKCGAGIFVWSTVLAYDADKLKDGPKTWKDFWDLKKYPGKRSMHKGPLYNLEIALLADGVAKNDVYKVLSTPAGVDRAFKKLDQIKSNIQWWEAGAQAAQYLAAGDVVMATAYNGRIAKAQEDGKNLKIVWDGNIYDFDYFAIPKGSPKAQEALAFINSSGKVENQKLFAEKIAYGPASKKALKSLSAKRLEVLPNSPQNGANAIAVSAQFWLDHGEDLEQRFNAWAAR